MKYKIDVVRIRENSIQLNGWVIGKTPESKAAFEVLDQNKKPLEIKYVATRRDDVSQIYYKQVYDRDYGFDIQFPYERGADYWLVIHCDGKTARVKYNEELIAKRASVAHKRMEKIKDLMNMETVHVALEFGKKHGLKALLLKSRHKLQGLDNDYDYGEWYELTRPKEEELAAQRETKFAYEPLLSIVIPAYKTPEKYLREMLDSILVDALAGFYVTGGGFRHTAGGERNDMATEQGYYALAAYYRFVNGQTRLYDMSDVAIQTGGTSGGDNSGNGTNNGGTPATGDTGVLVWAIALPVTILAAAFILKRKEREA